MNLRRSPAASPASTLVDAVMDGYVDWREESAAVELAYSRWAQAAASDREVAFDVYLAAVDREESAAGEYQRLIEHAQAAQR